jgi:hypothetical protein
MKIRQELLDYWEENGIDPPRQVVVCAANRSKCGIVVCGARHWDALMHRVVDSIERGGQRLKWEQGFIDQFGTFLTREEAMIVVRESGQPFSEERNGGAGKELFSEGLY